MNLPIRNFCQLLYKSILVFLFQGGAAFCQTSSHNPIVLPASGASTFIVESGKTYTANSAVSITLKPGVHFKSGSNVVLTVSANSNGPSAPHNPNENTEMNWTLAKSFDASGAIIGESKTFFDDNGKILQTQTNNIAAGHVLAVQPLYDVGGRQVGTTLSAPINNAAFSYKPDFARRADGASLNYRNYSRYINGSGEYDKTLTPDAVDKSQIGTVGWYYSTNNQWERLQDVTDYPYSTSTSPRDGTNILSMSGGLDAQTKMGSGHELVQFTVPAVFERINYILTRAKYFKEEDIGFPGAGGLTNQFLLNISLDRDQKSTISMTIDGKTVMTARAGTDLSLLRTYSVPKGSVDYLPVLKRTEFPNFKGTIKDYLRGETVKTYTGGENVVLEPGLYEFITAEAYTPNYSYGISDITYTFYDQLGRIRAIIPPEGMKKMVNGGMDNYATLASIPFVQTFEYDGKGNLAAQVSPDAGRSEFKYSSDSKLRYSQNALQRQKNRFSYTNYDQYGRSIESGELQPAGGVLFTSITPAMLDAIGASNAAYPAGTKYDVTLVKYDDADPIPTMVDYVQDSYFLSGSAVSSKARYSGAVSNANLVSKTWYNYDGDGNILWTVKYTPDLKYKTMDYVYDDMGNVTKSVYQKNTTSETFVHYFEYDRNKRLSSTYTNTTDNPSTKVLQAKYSYYLHGPLKRVELGDKLQGVDYVYSIDGKLKSINNANASIDPGKDGTSSGFAADVFGMNLEYYTGDYSNTTAGIPNIQTGSTVANYDGKINGISWFSRKPSSVTGLDAPAMNTFTYDAVDQLMDSRWGVPNFATSTFATAGEVHREKGMTYDSHGNIKSLIRTNGAGAASSNFSYNYAPNSNKLASVPGYATYGYDAIGQLASQVKGTAGMYLDYDVFGKVTKIYSNEAKTTVMLSFVYDDDGNRIQKKDHRNNSVTWYSYDGNGTLVAIFDNQGVGGAARLTEQPVYAADRLGTFYRQNSNYQYTISDHLGNTRVVINRTKLSNGAADIVYYADYYPFGSELRSGGIDSRYGYQGQYAERDKETGWNNFELRNYDAAIGRWLTTDPYGQYHSPYVGMGNNPVSGFDPNGGGREGGGGGLWGWLRGVFNGGSELNSGVSKTINLDEAVVTTRVAKKNPYEVFGRVVSSSPSVISAEKFSPTSSSYRQMMYNYSQMFANTNYNDMSNPTTSLAIGQNVAYFAGTQVAASKVMYWGKSLLNTAKGGLSNAQVRLWYNNQVKSLNTSVAFTEDAARALNAQRNSLKVQARGMMADRNAAALLDKTDPIRPFQYYVEKYTAQGYSGEGLWQRIIQGTSTPNAGVNAKFGIK